MQPSRGLQLALLCGVGALFFVATFLGQGGAVSNGTATGILAGACVVVLAGIFFVARRARSAAAAGTTEVPRRAGGPLRTTGFVVGIVLIELTQIASLPGWSRIMAGVCGGAAIVWALVALRARRK